MRFQTRRGQRQAVEHRFRSGRWLALAQQILYVRAEDAFLRLRFQLISNRFQYAVFLAAGEQRQLVRRSFGSNAPICSSICLFLNG
jgi:hypothetical protein